MTGTLKGSSFLKDILQKIEQADDLEINEIIAAVIRRYERVYPDWEVHFLSLHKDPGMRKEDVKGIIRLLEKAENGAETILSLSKTQLLLETGDSRTD